MQLIDTHVHINFDDFQGDLSSYRKSWQEAGVVHLVHSCVEPSEFQGIQSLADKFPELSFAVGLHPCHVEGWTDEIGRQIRTFASSDSRVVAIGETGLDFHEAENHQQQKVALQTQLSIAQELDMPVIIHCRDAALILKEQIEGFIKNGGKVKGVMHCWTGNQEETSWFLDLGFYISFSGIVTFKNKSIRSIKESAKIVPCDRLLIETDCPYLAPEPKRGQRPNQPAYVAYTAKYLANLRGVTVETIAKQTTSNACKLFNINLN